MHLGQMHYLPLEPAYFAILVGFFLLVVLLLATLRYAYLSLGVSSGTALLLLLASLVGSYFNIPVAQLPGQQVEAGQEITYFGIQYVVPVLVDWPGTVIAVNVGGAVIPTIMSLYCIIRYNLLVKAAIAIACIAAVCFYLARPVAGLGIALPIFVPVVTTAIVALILSRERAAPLAYAGGSLGTLTGADLLNLDHIQDLSTPMVSIGGAGTFDGIFLNAVLAVLIASVPDLLRRRPA